MRAKPAVAADGTGITAFGCVTVCRPAPLLNSVVGPVIPLVNEAQVEVLMGEGARIWRVLLLVALVVGGFAVLSVVFALLGWWQLMFR